MSTDPLAELARRARGPTPDPAWDALCRGELSEAERAALLAGEGAEALAPLFEPLGAEVADRLADLVIAGRVSAEGAPAPPPSHLRLVPPPADLPPRAPADRPANGPTPAAPRAAPWRRLAAVGLALAAAALLFLWLPSGGEGPLPAYTLEARHGDRVLRGEAPGGPSVSLGGRVVLVARPAEDAGPVEVHARLRPAAGGEAVPWGGEVEVSPAGSVRLSGVVGEDLVLAPGAWVVEISLTRPGGGGEERLLTSPLGIAP